MPNWCSNILIVRPNDDEKRSKVELTAFKLENRSPEEDLSLNSSVTMPPQYEEGDKWYDWRVSNWGTKWDVSDVQLEESKDMLTYSFETAWAPPVEWVKTVSKIYPMLSFQLEFEEPGVGLFGGMNIEDGDIIEEWENDNPYSEDDDDEYEEDDDEVPNTNALESTSTDLTPEEAYQLLVDGNEVMVKGWGGDEDMYTAVTMDDFEGETREEIISSLGGYDGLQTWD